MQYIYSDNKGKPEKKGVYIGRYEVNQNKKVRNNKVNQNIFKI